MISDSQRNIIIKKIERFNPNRIGIFGSFARNENTTKSDLDILVSFGMNITLFDLIEIEQNLSEKLGIKIDLVTEKSLSNKIKPFINQDIKYIYQC